MISSAKGAKYRSSRYAALSALRSSTLLYLGRCPQAFTFRALGAVEAEFVQPQSQGSRKLWDGVIEWEVAGLEAKSASACVSNPLLIFGCIFPEIRSAVPIEKTVGADFRGEQDHIASRTSR